jgi:hypothetical protein
MSAVAVRSVGGPRLINLVVPGGGLILIGNVGSGVLIAVLFTLSASFAMTAAWLFPDDVSRVWRGLSIGIALGTYLGAQLRYAQTVRLQADQAFWDLRREKMRTVRLALSEGRIEDAWLGLRPLMNDAETDLPLAFLVAQVLTLKGDGAAALNAWRHVRRLDRHRVYSRETRENEERLTRHSGVAPAPRSPESRSS